MCAVRQRPKAQGVGRHARVHLSRASPRRGSGHLRPWAGLCPRMDERWRPAGYHPGQTTTATWVRPGVGNGLERPLGPGEATDSTGVLAPRSSGEPSPRHRLGRRQPELRGDLGGGYVEDRARLPEDRGRSATNAADRVTIIGSELALADCAPGDEGSAHRSRASANRPTQLFGRLTNSR